MAALRFRCAQAGATLFEALVALLIFALALVGMAGLMAAGLKYQVGNEARLNVSSAINDLSERIRTNVAGANGYTAVVGGATTLGTGYQLSSTYATQVAATATSASPDCNTATCTPAQLATYDQIKWRNLLRATLPGGAGYITGDVVNGFTVTVMWADKSAVDESGSLISPATCSTDVSKLKTAAARFCCPAGASAPAGVRCYTALVIP